MYEIIQNKLTTSNMSVNKMWENHLASLSNVNAKIFRKQKVVRKAAIEKILWNNKWNLSFATFFD